MFFGLFQVLGSHTRLLWGVHVRGPKRYLEKQQDITCSISKVENKGFRVYKVGCLIVFRNRCW